VCKFMKYIRGILFAMAVAVRAHTGSAQSQIKADEHNRNASF